MASRQKSWRHGKIWFAPLPKRKPPDPSCSNCERIGNLWRRACRRFLPSNWRKIANNFSITQNRDWAFLKQSMFLNLRSAMNQLRNNFFHCVNTWRSFRNSIKELKKTAPSLSVHSMNRSSCWQSKQSRWERKRPLFRLPSRDQGKPVVAGVKLRLKTFVSSPA